MKKNLLQILFSIIVLLSFTAYAQLSGPYTIPGATFPTIEKAIDSLNQVGVGGNVTFNVTAGHTETFTKISAGLITATGYPDSQIVFQKSGVGSNPEITAGLGGISDSTDGIIVIAGGDYITFDGIDLQENSANLTLQNQMEWGYGLVKASKSAPFNGCRFVTIKNSTISLKKDLTISYGIYSGVHTADTTKPTLILTDTLDAMSYCKFYNNTIMNVIYGIRLWGYNNQSLYDNYNEIGVDGGNSITNYGGTTVQAYGINAVYQNNFKVANNTINGGSLSHTTSLWGISLGSTTNANVDIYNNTITLTSGATSSIMYGLSNTMGTSGTSNTVNIYNNTIENCSQPSATGNALWCIYNLAGGYNVNIYGNIIRNNSRPGSSTTNTVYGINNSGGKNAKVYNNEIYNNSSGYTIHGIYNDEGTNTHIYKNKIYDLRATGSDSSSYASGITIASGSTSSYVYNNFISDLKAPGSSSRIAIRGINITSTTANSNIGLYYNTIYLNATSGSAKFGTTGIYHTYSTTATTAVLDMRNNIVVNNSTPNGIGRTAAFRRSAATNLNNYSTISNNNSFYSGVGSGRIIYYDGTNEDQTIGDFKTRVDPRETSSFTENVPFVNNITTPYDLHVKTTVSTQTEGSGTPITTPIAVNTDFDNDSRNVTSPDVGADEFNGMALDITPPSISYTQLAHTLSTSNRNLNGVTITDGSGVNVTALPRIYYKKYSDANTYVDNTSSTNGWKFTETTSGASPFDFTIDYSLLFGGTAQSGDTIQYFVVAEDNASPANVGINSGTFSAVPSSVNLTSAAFPLTGTINDYRIQYLISGTVTVGTGGNYPSLTGPKGLFASINGNFVSGNVTANVISNTTETGDNALDQWTEMVEANYTLTIQPDAAVVRNLVGSYAGGLVRLNGADRVLFDGRFGGSGNYLSFENSNAASNTTVFQLLSLGAGQGCTDITIRNCNIKAGSNTVTNTFGIFVGSLTGSISTGNAGGAGYDNISFVENNISKCRTGIFARGTSADQMQNLIISGNVIGSNTASDYVNETGIYLGYADAPQVNSNEVFNLFYDVSKYGIYFMSYINNAVVSKNKVHSIDQPGTSGFQSGGINFSSSTGCSNNLIENNMVYNINTYGNSSMYLTGIRIVGGSNYKVYYNSVNLSGAFGNTSTGVVSACFHIQTTASTNLDMRDNIFSNTRTGNNPKNYTVHSPSSTTFSNLDYNNYWSTGSVFGYFSTDIANYSSWKTTVGKDANSSNVAVTFVSATDAHLSGASIGDPYLAGTPISGITTDIDGDTRNTTYPYKGADETTAFTLYALNLTALIEGFYSPIVDAAMVPDSVTLELRNASSPYSLVDNAKVLLNSAGNGTFNYLFAADATNYYLVVKHRNSVETWSKNPQQFSVGSLTYDFTSAQTQAYGDNMVLKGTKWCIYSGDVNQDGVIDITDVGNVDTDNLNFANGYLVTDVTGDNLVDISDVSLTDTNNLNFISKVTPTIILLKRDKIQNQKTNYEIK